MYEDGERELEQSYRQLCEFEKPHYEKLNIDSDGTVELTIDKDLYSQLESMDNANADMFEPVKYPSYSSLFNDRYRNNFKRNLTALKYSSIENETGKRNLENVIQRDQELQKIYRGITKERDLDNDGIPDRIDIDDTRNSVQTVKDLNVVKNSTTGGTQRYNEKKERQEKEKERQRGNELEL
jgi:hypothetical protein